MTQLMFVTAICEMMLAIDTTAILCLRTFLYCIMVLVFSIEYALYVTAMQFTALCTLTHVHMYICTYLPPQGTVVHSDTYH